MGVAKMKKVLLILVILIIALPVMAEPFLISDPYGSCGKIGETECPVSFNIYAGDVLIVSEQPVQDDLSIKYDLVSMPIDQVEYTAQYVDQHGRVSDLCSPLLLLVPPIQPFGLDVEL